MYLWFVYIYLVDRHVPLKFMQQALETAGSSVKVSVSSRGMSLKLGIGKIGKSVGGRELSRVGLPAARAEFTEIFAVR